MKFVAKQKDNQQRLDKFIKAKLKNQSRSQIQKMIQAGWVLLNDQAVSVHHFLNPGDVITFPAPKKTKPITPTRAKKITLPPNLQPKIIFENEDFLVLDKPAGLLVHPTEKNEAETLVGWLLKKYPDIESVGENYYRAGIIHRLDRDVSGVMVAAKNQKAFAQLKEQFKQRQVKKEYLALVYGHLTQAAGEIDLPIGRNPDGQFVAHPRRGKEKFQASDKIAKTKYRVLEYIKDYSLLRVEILTGRTHQIRVHLSAIGHPIIGDQIYKPKQKIFHFLRRRIKVVDAPRIMLHSQKIGFYDLKNEWREFSSPLPPALKNYLNEIKK